MHALLSICDMIVMASTVNGRNTINTDSLNVIYLSSIFNTTKNLLNEHVVRSGLVYLIIYRMHHQWRNLNMPIRNLMFNTGTLAKGSNIIYERF